MGINKGLSYRFLKGEKENHKRVILIHCFRVLEKTASEVSGLMIPDHRSSVSDFIFASFSLNFGNIKMILLSGAISMYISNKFKLVTKYVW